MALTGTALALAGPVVSIYLIISHYIDPRMLACPGTGAISCAKVTTSPEPVILGIPVAAYGLLFFAVSTEPGDSPGPRLGAEVYDELFRKRFPAWLVHRSGSGGKAP